MFKLGSISKWLFFIFDFIYVFIYNQRMGALALILDIIGVVVIPFIALFFAWRGIKAWQIIK